MQAILFCILEGKAAHSMQLLESVSFIKKMETLGFFATRIGAVLMGASWEVCSRG